MSQDLITKADYDKLNPYEQGFVQYMQGARPGSELKDCRNTYPEGSKEREQWYEGAQYACQLAQDSEE